MIVQMSRIYAVARRTDKDRLVERLGQLGLLHIEPVKPDDVVGDEEALNAMTDLNRAIKILSPIEPEGLRPDQKPVDAAREAIEIRASITGNQNRLAELHRMAETLSVWGNVTLKQLEALRESGLDILFFSVSRKHADSFRAECMEMVAELPGNRALVAVIDRGGRFQPPDEAETVALPSRDRPSIRAEAEKIEAHLKQDVLRLSQLAGLLAALREERDRLAVEVERLLAQQGGVSRGALFALKGWVPAESAGKLASRLSEYGVHAAVRVQAAQEDETPPTLIRYPFWTKPIKGVFDILGALPGYREMDLSPFFMVALPIFAALLIGDAGYGLLIALTGLVFYGRVSRIAGKPKAQLVVIFGLAALVWGMLTANYFGITPETLARRGGFVRSAGAGGEVDYAALRSDRGFYSRTAKLMWRTAPLWREDSRQARFLMMQVSLIIGCLHLILGRFRRLVERIPNRQALAELGWIVALGDILVVIWHLLFIGADRVPATVWWVLLAAMSFPVWFGKPYGNAGKRILLGCASSILPLLNTFSDTMSYLRLFAVGMASYYIASAFNMLGAKVAVTATWFTAAPILVFGHSLNIGLAVIAIFAHGVRLNMLEFSNHAGVQWEGYAYRPFTLFTGNRSPDQNNTFNGSISGEKIS